MVCYFYSLSLVDALSAATRGSMARLYSKQDIWSPCWTPLSTFIGAGVTLFIITEVLALLEIVFTSFVNSLRNLNSSRISHRYL